MVSLDGSVLTLAFAQEGYAKGFAGNGHDQRLCEVIEGMLGIRLTIKTIVGTPHASSSR
jgi:hypothetical protein